MIGNSVPPQFARLLALAVRAQVFGETLPWPIELLRGGEQLGFRQRKRSRTRDYQSKARYAIAEAPVQRRLRTAAPRTYRATLTPAFQFTPADNGPLRVEFLATGSEWALGVKLANRRVTNRILLTPAYGQVWSLPVSRVNLVFGNDEQTFTAVWKAFGAELIRGGYKADLVQLSGYYQYKPSIQAEAKFGKQCGTNWFVLASVVAGVGVAATVPTRDLATHCSFRDFLYVSS